MVKRLPAMRFQVGSTPGTDRHGCRIGRASLTNQLQVQAAFCQCGTSEPFLRWVFILNIGGFSDAVFGVVSAFLRDDSGRFTAEVEAVEL